MCHITANIQIERTRLRLWRQEGFVAYLSITARDNHMTGVVRRQCTVDHEGPLGAPHIVPLGLRPGQYGLSLGEQCSAVNALLHANDASSVCTVDTEEAA